METVEINLKKTERIDILNKKGYRIIQDTEGFCFGIDAVLLSSFAIVHENDRVLDLCTGTGVVPILLEAKTKGEMFCGVELQEEVCDMAKRSVKLNELEKRVEIRQGDIRQMDQIYPKASFQVVTVNPPYMPGNKGLVSSNQKKAISRTEILCSLEDVISQSSQMLEPYGRMYMVHRPSRLKDILILLNQYRMCPRLIRFVHPFEDKEANLVLIEAVKNANHLLVIEPPCIVYDENRNYTKEMTDIYFEGMLMKHMINGKEVIR